MSNLDERIQKRKEKSKKRQKYLKNIFLLSMISITISCIFITDYNMNKMLNKKSLITQNTDLIQKNINLIQKYLEKLSIKIKI